MSNPQLSFVGLADFYLKPYGVDAAARATGGLAKCQLTPQIDKKEQKNYGKAGGKLAINERFVGATLAMTFQSLSIANLALMLRGGVTAVAAGTISSGSAETYKAYLGGLIRLNHINPAAGIVVKNEAGDTTYVAGVDYTVTGAGVIPLATGSIVDASNLKISGAYGASQIVDAFINSANEYTVYADGINEQDGNKPVVIDLYRLRFGAAKNVDIVGDDFANLEVEAELLLDPTQTGVGASKFFRWVYGSATA